MPITDFVDKVKEFNVAGILSNTLENITDEELKIFDKLGRKVNKNDKLYMEFENSIVKKIEKKYVSTKIKTFE